jgi:protein-S-isoprenylcysteine O-methyltransferase Ste14
MSVEKSSWWKGERGEWYVVIQFILFGIVLVLPFLFERTTWPEPWITVARVVGIALGFIGAELIVSGVIRLGNNLTAVPHPKDDATFVTSGAYKYVRHPIYSGILFLAFAWGLLLSSWPTLAAAAVLFLFFDLKTRREERFLAAKFPQYADYQRRVRKLVPFIY